MIKNLAKKKRKKEDGPEPVANQTSVQRSEYGRRKVRFQNERERDLVVEHGNQQSWDTIRQCGVYLLFCFEGGGGGGLVDFRGLLSFLEGAGLGGGVGGVGGGAWQDLTERAGRADETSPRKIAGGERRRRAIGPSAVWPSPTPTPPPIHGTRR